MTSADQADSAAGDGRIVIVAGLAGAGRSTALNALEDIGFETVDTPPMTLAPMIVETLRRRGASAEQSAAQQPIALGFGGRMPELTQALFDDTLARLRALAGPGGATVLFLDCADQVLIRRYTETRRRHPLAPHGGVEEGLVRDRAQTAPFRAAADLMIDTSQLTWAELRREVAERFSADASALTVSVLSFSYKRGLPPEADVVFDCRFLSNPHYQEALRPLDGRDAPVAAFVAEDPGYAPFMAHVTAMAEDLLPAFQREGKSYLTIAFGCTGGKHRSVAVAEAFTSHLRNLGRRINLKHRERSRSGH